MVQGLGFRVEDVGFRVKGLGFSRVTGRGQFDCMRSLLGTKARKYIAGWVSEEITVIESRGVLMMNKIPPQEITTVTLISKSLSGFPFTMITRPDEIVHCTGPRLIAGIFQRPPPVWSQGHGGQGVHMHTGSI